MEKRKERGTSFPGIPAWLNSTAIMMIPGLNEENSQPEDQRGTRWYSREEFRQLGTVGFVIDASPVFQESFTVTDNRIFGSGTLYRAIQQADAMQGANIITFDDALEQADALELPIYLALKDKTTISGFNMTIFAGADNVDGENAETVNEEEDGSDDGSEEEEENTADLDNLMNRIHSQMSLLTDV